MAISCGSSNAASTEGVLRQQQPLNCGVSEPTGGRQASAEGARTVPKRGDETIAETNHWLGQSHGRPSELVAAGLEALDSLNLGVAITNGSRQLLLANRTAEQILATGDGLEVTSQGVLGTLKRSCNPPLSAVIQRAAQGGLSVDPSSKDAVLAVQRPSGKRPLTLLVRAVQGMSSEMDAFRLVLIFMIDPELPIQATEAGLRQIFGLTTREARLAHLLMSGKTLDDCCDQLDIRPSTARMHLGNLFAKTRVERQGQLISLLFRSVGVVRAANVDRKTSEAGPYPHRGGRNKRDGRSNPRAPDTLAASLEALDLVNIGVGVTNSLRQLLFANHTAQQILAARDGLEVTAGGVLGTLKDCCSPPLGALIQQAAQGDFRGTSRPEDTVLAVRRPSGKRSLTLLVRSLNGRSPQPHPTGPAVLVFVLDPELPVQANESGLRQLYGFTSSEARLAHLLMEGNTLDDCCDQLNIRPSTARMHLGNLFAKAGVQRQGQLISLLLKSVGMVRVRSEESSLKPATSHDPLP
jgi:DNA-binding CsgD family transcriptional regulator